MRTRHWTSTHRNFIADSLINKRKKSQWTRSQYCKRTNSPRKPIDIVLNGDLWVFCTSQKDKRTTLLKSTKMYLEDSLLHATRPILNARAHERFMRRKSPLTHTTTTTTTRKARLRKSICEISSVRRNWNNRCHSIIIFSQTKCTACEIKRDKSCDFTLAKF